MNMTLRTAGTGLLLSVLLVCGAVDANAKAALPLGSSSQIPAAQGDVRLRTTRNGNVEIRMQIQHLAPPARIVAGASVFVVWLRGQEAGAVAQNLGALRVDKNLGAKFTTVTALPSFDLFITCEQSQTTTIPSEPELLPLHYTQP